MGELFVMGLSLESLTSILEQCGEQIDEFPAFIETGTNYGGTILEMQPYFDILYTVELSESYFERFNAINTHGNIISILGDSTQVLPSILSDLNSNAIFWLDGHWSQDDTAQGEKDCPLVEEFNAINNVYQLDKTIIIVDDYRLFGRLHGVNWTDITEEKLIEQLTVFDVVDKFVYEDRLIVKVERK